MNPESELNDLHDSLDSEGPVTLPSSGTRPPHSAEVIGPSDVIKKRRGRPPGSKNRPKQFDATGNPIKEALGKDHPLLQVVCKNEREFAMVLAQVAVFANVSAHATKWEPVAESLGWVSQDSAGQWSATKRCVFGSALCWPYIKESGLLDSLDNVPPIVLCIIGALILVGPAVVPAYKVLKASRKLKPVEVKKDNPKKEEDKK